MPDRLTLCLPQDVARAFDTTVRNTQIDGDIFQATEDDWDLLASIIEDTEDEFHMLTDSEMKVGREGVSGTIETYEQLTYDISGHEQTKQAWTGTASTYRRTERTTALENTRVVPFDPAEGDEAYIYRGMSAGNSDTWEDVTNERGNLWDIINHRDGRLVISPVELARAMRSSHHGLSLGGRNRLREVRFAISYRYGSLGGSRSMTAETELDAELNATDETTIAVTDGSRFPGSSQIIVKLGREYISVKPDPQNDSMDILERAVRGTEAQEHDSDATVYYTPPAVRNAVASKAAASLATSSRGQKWLPDNEDDLDKNDIIQNLNQTWQTTIDVLQ